MRAAVVRQLAEIASQLAGIAVQLAEGDASNDHEVMLTEAEAALEARCSIRTLREARRTGALTMYGRQRSRTVRRSDLRRWIESRATKPVVGVDDADMARRMRRIRAARR
jgi:hypothetical protein